MFAYEDCGGFEMCVTVLSNGHALLKPLFFQKRGSGVLLSVSACLPLLMLGFITAFKAFISDLTSANSIRLRENL